MFCNKAGDDLNPNLTVEQRNKLFIDTAETIMAQEGSKYYLLRRQINQAQDNSASAPES